MQIKSIEMTWISVKDLKQAVKFYTDVVGLKLMEMHEQFGWAELQGHLGDGARLGLAQIQNDVNLPVYKNAVVTLTVDNIEKAKENLKNRGVTCVGDIEEVPGHVKLQMVVDHDGNHMQLVEKLF